MPTFPTTQTPSILLTGLLFTQSTLLQANCCFIHLSKEYTQAKQQYLEGKNKTWKTLEGCPQESPWLLLIIPMNLWNNSCG